MKLTTSKLKKIIKEELMNETQKPLGLRHVFSNFDLAQRILQAIKEEASEETIMGLRNIAMKRIALTRRDIGQGIDADNKRQEDMFLQLAVDEIDKFRGDYDMSVDRSSFDPESKSRLGIPDEGPYAGYALKRRAQQDYRQGQEDVYRHAAEQRAKKLAGKPYLPYVQDRFLDDDINESLSYEGDDSILEAFHGATLEDGGLVCEACLFEMLQEASCGCPNLLGEAVYQGKKVTLNKPTRGDVKKFKVYVNSGKKDSKGRVKAKKVNFGDKKMKIKKNNPKRRKSFRARHNCKNPGPKTKARYWSCKKW
jgi:hypothetical protein